MLLLSLLVMFHFIERAVLHQRTNFSYIAILCTTRDRPYNFDFLYFYLIGIYQKEYAQFLIKSKI